MDTTPTYPAVLREKCPTFGGQPKSSCPCLSCEHLRIKVLGSKPSPAPRAPRAWAMAPPSTGPAATTKGDGLRHAFATVAAALRARPRKSDTEIDPDDYDTVEECIEDGNDPDACKEVIEQSAAKCTCKTKMDPAATHVLSSVVPHEVSFVDSAANRWEFLVKMIAYRIAKSPSGAAARTVIGVVSEPGVADAHGDIMTKATVAAAQAAFEKSGCLRVQHSGSCLAPSAARITSSRILAKAETIAGKRVPAGAWVIETSVMDKALIAAIDAGQLRGWSIGALAAREPIAKAVKKSNPALLDRFNEQQKPAAAPTSWGLNMSPAAVAKKEAAAEAARVENLKAAATTRNTGDASAQVAAKRALGVDVGNVTGLDMARDVERTGRKRAG